MRLTATVHASLASLPPAARALLPADLCANAGWWRACETAALPAGWHAAYLCLEQAKAAVAVVPLLRRPGAAAAFTTPYTVTWAPALAPGADLFAVGRAWGGWLRRQALRAGTVRLDALDLADPAWPPLQAGLREAGWVSVPFAHFGNWSGAAPSGWAAYLAARPGELREALRRRGRKLWATGATPLLVRDPSELAAGIAAYEAVYAKSWKQQEPYPGFVPALMREAASAGTLRLGLLQRGGVTIATQFWIAQPPWASVLKLAHDEAERALSPGTVLTGWMIEHLLAEGVTRLDFGRGDDPYKRAWANDRAPRDGLMLALPWHPAGALVCGKAWLKARLPAARPLDTHTTKATPPFPATGGSH